MDIYLLHFLKQHLSGFVDQVYWCGLKGPCNLVLFVNILVESLSKAFKSAVEFIEKKKTFILSVS